MLLREIGAKYFDYLLFTKEIDPRSLDDVGMFYVELGTTVILAITTIATVLVAILGTIILINQIRIKKLLKKLAEE